MASDLDAAIRERLDRTGGPLHANAIRAVMDRHKVDLYGACSDCASYDENPVPWPCDTVLDIARELRVAAVERGGQP